MSTLDVLSDPPRAVRSRFELAALRLADHWLRTGHLEVAADDLLALREYFAGEGLTLEPQPGLVEKLGGDGGEPIEMTREDALLLAFRRLASAEARRREAMWALTVAAG